MKTPMEQVWVSFHQLTLDVKLRAEAQCIHNV
jgi:hypothetical protein